MAGLEDVAKVETVAAAEAASGPGVEAVAAAVAAAVAGVKAVAG